MTLLLGNTYYSNAEMCLIAMKLIPEPVTDLTDIVAKQRPLYDINCRKLGRDRHENLHVTKAEIAAKNFPLQPNKDFEKTSNKKYTESRKMS